MRLLYVSETVGKPGVFALRHTLQALRDRYKPDFILGNGDGATGGFGLGKNHAFYLHKLGLQAITLGECAYYKKDLHPVFEASSFLLRPANLPLNSPGRGWKLFSVGNMRLAVISLLGQTGWSRLYPFQPLLALDDILAKLAGITPLILVDFHAGTTAEKQLFFSYADGKVSAVVGSHTKVMTGDERISAKGTALLTDAGRTGSQLSVGGFEPAKEIERLETGVPLRSLPSWADLAVQGIFIDIDEKGHAVALETFTESCQEVPHESTGNDHED
jgi:metallophosphoesterase (TIGR00282 family)